MNLDGRRSDPPTAREEDDSSYESSEDDDLEHNSESSDDEESNESDSVIESEEEKFHEDPSIRFGGSTDENEQDDEQEYYKDEEDPSQSEKEGNADNDIEMAKKEEPPKELTLNQQLAQTRYLTDPKRRVRALSEQCYHLPGNNWKEDWLQYFANNHPVFGICFHFPEHPIGWGMRFMCFVSSVVFGLAITNMFWLWARSTDRNDSLFTVETGNRPGSNLTGYVIDVNDESNVEVTTDIALLWTVGGFVHGLFDNLIWTLSICACCSAGGRFEHLAKYRRFGVGLLAFFIVLVMAVTTLSVVVRGVMESDEESSDVKDLKTAGVFDDQLDLSQSTKDNYEFLMSYFVELALAMFVYFPLTGTILFWGVLGCFRSSQCGGRAYEVEQERKELEALLENPEMLDSEWDDDLDDELEVWGMRPKDEQVKGGERNSGGCFWDCFKGRNKDAVDTDSGSRSSNSLRTSSRSTNNRNGRDNSDYESSQKTKYIPKTSRDASELNWSSYPSVGRKNKKEKAGVATKTKYTPKPTKEASDVKWSSYPKVLRKNKKEKAGSSSGNSKYTPKTSKDSSDVNWSSYPKVSKKNRKEDVTGESAKKKKKKSSKTEKSSKTKSSTTKNPRTSVSSSKSRKGSSSKY